VVNRIIAEPVTAFVQAGRSKRTAQCRVPRHGTRTRFLATRVSRLQLRVPRVRGGGFQPTAFARYQRSEQAFLATVMEMVVRRVSPRRVLRGTTEPCGTRSLAENRYTVLLVDVLRLKIRDGGHLWATSGLDVTGE
jgi:transposase-like protein